MIWSLAWKEYREQRPVWIAVALLAAALMFGVLEFIEPVGTALLGATKTFALIGIAVALSVAYGFVSGAMLLSGERENRTLDYLDMAAGGRSRIWLTKFVIGAGSVIALSLLVAAPLVWARASWTVPNAASSGERWNWLWFLPFWSSYAFVSGLIGSSTAGSVVRAAGLGVVYAIVCLVVGILALTAVQFSSLLPKEMDDVLNEPSAIIGLSLFIMVLLANGSFFLFCGIDRQRRIVEQEGIVKPATGWRHSLFVGFRSLLWLTWQQGKALALGMLIACLGIAISVAICVLLVGAQTTRALLTTLTIWPCLTLTISVIAGLASFGGEQSGQGQRFLGDQRFSARRVWWMKTSPWFLAATLMSLVASVGMSFAYLVPREGYHSQILWPFRLNDARWLLWAICLMYGFGVGQFCVTLFQRPALAGIVAAVIAACAIIWMPSLIEGGAHWLLVLLPALLLMVASRLLAWPWLTGQISGFHARITVVISISLAIGSLAFGIGYRVWEIPDVPAPFDVEAYAKRLTAPLGTPAGMLAHAALKEMDKRLELARRYFPADSNQAQDAAAIGRLELIAAMAGVAVQTQIAWLSPAAAACQMPISRMIAKESMEAYPLVHRVNRLLFGDDVYVDTEMEELLQFVCQQAWTAKLRQLQDLAAGALVDPRDGTTIFHDRNEIHHASTAILILCNRARLRKQRSKFDQALDDYRTCLALILTMNNQADDYAAQQPTQSLDLVLRELSRWAVQSSANGQLLISAQSTLEHFEQALPTMADYDKATYLKMRSFLEQFQFSEKIWPGEPPLALANIGPQIPWERERQRRILDAEFAGRLEEDKLTFSEWAPRYVEQMLQPRRGERIMMEGWVQPKSYPISREQLAHWVDETWWQRYLIPFSSQIPNARIHCKLRAARLRLALIRYEADHGHPAAALGDLAPKFIDRVPDDPYDGKPFRYRVSSGETIRSLNPMSEVTNQRNVLAGQGIIWSVGPDCVDDGGMVEGEVDLRFPKPNQKTGDLIFVVPSVQQLATRK